ncbi:MAG: hypothetical protein MJ156_01325 [Alphaproteobacteria bacterium]|nr:hypothetical protein [Alphaproteobacteria bacterium]
MTEKTPEILKKEDFKNGRQLAAFLKKDFTTINESLKHFYKIRKKISYKGHLVPMVTTEDHRTFRLHPQGLSIYEEYINSKGSK